MDEARLDSGESARGLKSSGSSRGKKLKDFTPGKCGLCESTAGTSEDHIIPRGALKRIRGDDKDFVKIDTHRHKPVDYKSDAYWQRGLLCPKCEKKCADLERAWFKLDSSHFKHISGDCSFVPWVIPGVDASLVTRFVISVLLRAHVSTRPEFDCFTLGSASVDSMRVFNGEVPERVGFKLLTYVPVFEGKVGRCNMPPSFLENEPVIEIWLGVFRMLLYPPGAEPSVSLLPRTKHSQRHGLITARVDIERLPKYKGLLAQLDMAGREGRLPPPEIDSTMQAKFDRKRSKAMRRLPVR